MRTHPGRIVSIYFPDEDYARSMVTDRPNPEESSTSAAADLPVPSHKEPTHATGLEAGLDPGEPPATLPEPNSKHSSDEAGSRSLQKSYFPCQKPQQEGPE